MRGMKHVVVIILIILIQTKIGLASTALAPCESEVKGLNDAIYKIGGSESASATKQIKLASKNITTLTRIPKKDLVLPNSKSEMKRDLESFRDSINVITKFLRDGEKKYSLVRASAQLSRFIKDFNENSEGDELAEAEEIILVFKMQNYLKTRRDLGFEMDDLPYLFLKHNPFSDFLDHGIKVMPFGSKHHRIFARYQVLGETETEWVIKFFELKLMNRHRQNRQSFSNTSR